MAAARRSHPLQHSGARQGERRSPALDPASVAVDGRDADQLLVFASEFAEMIRFPALDARELDWTGFFEAMGGRGVTAIERNPQLGPHAALFLAFLRLYDISRGYLNGLSRRHLDFYYRQVLGLAPRPPRPDRAHLLFEAARNRPDVGIPADTALKAGDFLYRTNRELFADHAAVTRLHTVYREPGAAGRLRYALAADSADGLGAPLEGDSPSWRAFGHADLPAMSVGFALAGPTLMLAEGERTIDLTLELDLPGGGPGLPSNDRLPSGLEAELSGTDAWLGPLCPASASLTPRTGGQTLAIKLELGADVEAVSIYDPTKLPGGFATSAPVVKVLLRADADPALYAGLARAFVASVAVAVTVKGVTDLHLENDLGRLNPEKPFMPFGPQPVKGGSFYVGSPETFAKKLEDYSLHLKWQDVPDDLSDHYRAYLYEAGTQRLRKTGITEVAAASAEHRVVKSNSHFKATMRLIRSGNADTGVSVDLFDPEDATRARELLSDPGAPLAMTVSFPVVQALFTAPVPRARVQFPLVSTQLSQPLVGGLAPEPLSFLPVLKAFPLPVGTAGLSLRQQRRLGYIRISLKESFLHKEFPYLFSAVAQDEDGSDLPPNPPYTPVLESLTMDYRASSGPVQPASTSQTDYQAKTLQLFHLTPFGQAEEHGWLKQSLDHVTDTRARLLPGFEDEGSLYLGLEQARVGSHLDLLIQVAEGSANPEKTRRNVRWSLLNGNHWRPLADGDLLREETNQLLRSGIVTLRLPSVPIPANTAFDPTLTWLRAAVDRDTDAVCRFIGVHTQAVDAELGAEDTAADPAHLATALPAGTIAKLASARAGVKGVSQPYSSFDGRPAEQDLAFDTRVAERLRHKQRALSLWDYERLTLEAFPGLYSVKVLSHTRPGSTEAPGHVTVVAVPDIRNRNAYDPLQPRVDLDTLSRIQDFLRGLCPPKIEVHAVNPSFEEVRLELSLRFDALLPFGPYSERLNLDLQRQLSPWAFDSKAPLRFGGRLHKSELLRFVDTLAYVERVEAFKLYHLTGTGAAAGPVAQDQDEVVAAGPDSVLVSHPAHDIKDAGAGPS